MKPQRSEKLPNFPSLSAFHARRLGAKLASFFPLAIDHRETTILYYEQIFKGDTQVEFWLHVDMKGIIKQIK